MGKQTVTDTAAERVEILAYPREDQHTAFARDVAAGLRRSPKSLSCRFLYDAAGSLLFEEICAQPEYYVMRAEAEILQAHAPELASILGPKIAFVELGSGSGVKTRIIIDALLAAGTQLTWVPVDISRSALVESARGMSAEFEALQVTGVAGEYERGIEWIADHPRCAKLVAFLGSNIGNYTRDAAAELLCSVRAAMTADDRLLLGIDLRKDAAVLAAAYDDAKGVTARFNKNLLERINSELGGTFDTSLFDHSAIYDGKTGCVSSGLIARRAHTVRITELDLDVSFGADECIHTENSVKYSLDEIDEVARRAGLRVERRWLDGKARFSLNLLTPL
ncbi:MAG: L-histidine N-alpha-methyltransferase [Planctomycetota bacterium]|jgi:L-histidine N-alpha-methyltransferase